jgi:hypothetical protein
MIMKCVIMFFVLFNCGCSPSTKYTINTDYTESRKVDPKKGWVRGFTESLEVEWEN